MFEKHPSGSFDGKRRREKKAKINIDISEKEKKDRLTCSCQQFRAVCLTMANTPLSERGRIIHITSIGEIGCAQVLDVCIERSRSSKHTHKPECIKETAVEKGLNILGPIAVGPSSHFYKKLVKLSSFLYRPSSIAKRENESLLAFGHHCRSYSRHFQLPRTAQFHQGINNSRFGIVDPRGIIWGAPFS